MNVRILGYSGGYPGAGIPTSGYLLSFNQTNILIDCGSGVLCELIKYIPFECLDAVIVTHLHHDHTSDLRVLRYALDMKSKNGQAIRPIPLYVPHNPASLFAEYDENALLPVSVIDERLVLSIAGATISFHPSVHSVECYGIRVEYNTSIFTYSSDSSLDIQSFSYLRDADLAILDCGGLEKNEKNDKKHMSPGDCFRLFSEFGIKRVVLSHLIPYHDVSDTIAEASSFGDWPYEVAEMGRNYIME